MSPGPTQLLIIALIVLLLFGANRLSEASKGPGEGIRNFNRLPPSRKSPDFERADQPKSENA